MIKAQPIRRNKKRTTMVNPHRKAHAKARPKRKSPRRKSSGAPRRNPGATVLLGTLNPENSMKKRKNSKKSFRRSSKKPRTNPHRGHTMHAKRSQRRKYKRNPEFAKGIISKPVQLLKAGAVGALAFFATRQIPQYLLKEKNFSWVGYFANFLTALAATWAADKYFGAAAGQAAFVGGGMYVFNRIADEQTPLGKEISLVSGLRGVRGDPRAVGVGSIVPGYFAAPPISDRNGNPIIPQQIIDASVAAMRANVPAAAGVGRFASRH